MNSLDLFLESPMNVTKLSALANALLELAAEVEAGTQYVNSQTLIQISQQISSSIKTNDPYDCKKHSKLLTGNVSPTQDSCSCPLDKLGVDKLDLPSSVKKVKFNELE